MAKPGIQYRHPWIYSLFIPLIHRPSVVAAFRREVGKRNRVFDIAAGFGQMAKYIDPSNTYSGIDLNQTYIDHAKARGLEIRRGSIFDAKQYMPHDVSILVDVVHHMPHNKLPELFDLIFKHAGKRVVILEPSFVNFEKRLGRLGRPIDWMLKKLDSDGVNDIDHWLSEAEYTELFTSKFRSKHGDKFTLKIEQIHPYYLVTYTRKTT
jgi:SAM-dependent methyltransferase